MRLHHFVFLMATTVILGTLCGGFLTLLGGLLNFHIPWYIGLVSGAFLSTTSLMGFWAYLTLNFIARQTLPRRVWRWAQVLITVWTLYDMLWWRYQLNTGTHTGTHTGTSASYMTFFVQGMWPFVAALAAAFFKRKLSGKGSYLPTVFYLYVFTIVDWLLVIRADTHAVVTYTGIIMMVCNVYLVLLFGKLLTPVSTPVKPSQQATNANRPIDPRMLHG